VKSPVQYRAMETLCRRRAELDKARAKYWLEQAELCEKLSKLEELLEMLENRRLTNVCSQEKRPSARRAQKTEYGSGKVFTFKERRD
jgi:hypothetical protein